MFKASILQSPHKSKKHICICSRGGEGFMIIKKTTVWLLLLCFLVSKTCYAQESYINEAKILYELGLYKGVSQYYFESDLSSFSDKETAIVFILRLAGKGNITSFINDYQADRVLNKYHDKDIISPWAKNYIAYAIENNMIPDIEQNWINPKRLVDGKTFTAILLNSMGYMLGEDTWKISTYINCYLGGISADEAKAYADKILTKNDIIFIVWKTFNIKTASGMPYLNSIINSNSLSRERLINMGFFYIDGVAKPPIIVKNNTNLAEPQQGKYIMKDGSVFIGGSINGVPNGYGVINYEDGSRYEGSVVDGYREGEGRFVRNDGFVYSGSWKNDKMWGYGNLIWPNGDSYSGNLYFGYFEGIGTMVWASGDSYTGEWIEGKFSGRGKFSWSNGNYYDGEWSFGEFNGYGVFYTVDGSMFEGQWLNGKKNGRGKEIFANNTILECVWENDIYLGP